MTPEETRIVDRLVLLEKLTKLRQVDRNRAGSSWSQAWRDKALAFEESAQRLSSSLSAYIAHGIHDRDDLDRALIDYCRNASRRIDSLLPAGEEHAETRQAVLDATKDYGIVTSVNSLNRFLSNIENRQEVRDRLNAALMHPARAQGHGGAVPDFTEETARQIARHFAHLQEHVHSLATSAGSIFDHPRVDPVPWDTQERAERIAEVERDLTALDNVRAAAPREAEPPQAPQAAVERPAKRKRQEIEPLSWKDQRRRLRSDEAAEVERTAGLRPMDRPRFRGSEEIRRILDPRRPQGR